MNRPLALLGPTVDQLDSFPEGAEYNSLSGLLREAHKNDGEGLLTRPQIDQVFEHYIKSDTVILVGRVAFDAASEQQVHGFLLARREDEMIVVDELFVDTIARRRRLGTTLLKSAVDIALDYRVPGIVYGRRPDSNDELALLDNFGFHLPAVGYPHLELTN